MLVDANVLLYAVNRADPRHAVAHRWLRQQLNGRGPIGLSWMALLAFLRIATAPAFAHPLSVSQALGAVAEWIDAPPASLVEPTPRHMGVLRGLLEETGTAGNIVSDAHLAALALEHAMPLATFDRDFHRFRGVRIVTPHV